MADASQVIPLYRRSPSELLQEWEQEAHEYGHTITEFRRRLDRASPDRRERLRFAIQINQAHVEALRYRIERARGLPGVGEMATLPEEEPEPVSRWQSR